MSQQSKTVRNELAATRSLLGGCLTHIDVCHRTASLHHWPELAQRLDEARRAVEVVQECAKRLLAEKAGAPHAS